MEVGIVAGEEALGVGSGGSPGPVVGGASKSASMDEAGDAAGFFFLRGGRLPCLTSSSSCALRLKMWW